MDRGNLHAHSPLPVLDPSISKYELERALSGHDHWRMSINGIPVADLPRTQFDSSVEFGKLIISFWSQDFSQSWRVVGIDAHPERLRLDLTRKMGIERIHLELRPLDAPDDRAPGAHFVRRQSAEAMMGSLRSHFPAVTIERVWTGRASIPGLSSIYARVVFQSGQRRMAALAMEEGDSDEGSAHLLTAGILWITALSAEARPVERCLLLVPKSQTRGVARCMTSLSAGFRSRLELYEWSPAEGALEPIQPVDQGLLFDPATTRLPKVSRLPTSAGAEPEILRSLPPAIRAFRHPSTGELAIRCRGLEIGRITSRGQRVNPTVAQAAGMPVDGCTIEQLAERVATIRHAQCEDRWHPLYRWQAERWLEEMIRDEPTAIDPELDPGLIYPQIPAHDDGGRGLVDLLGMRSNGRLVIMELKVTEDVRLPMQGLDYWLRVEWHRRRGDFRRRGYFPGKNIAPQPAALYLVAPIFEFHRGFEGVARGISAEVPVFQIGINANWRSRIKVLRHDLIGAVGRLT